MKNKIRAWIMDWLGISNLYKLVEDTSSGFYLQSKAIEAIRAEMAKLFNNDWDSIEAHGKSILRLRDAILVLFHRMNGLWEAQLDECRKDNHAWMVKKADIDKAPEWLSAHPQAGLMVGKVMDMGAFEKSKMGWIWQECLVCEERRQNGPRIRAVEL